MKFYKHNITCPNCAVTIIIPITPRIEAQAKENYDLAEVSAQEQYNSLCLWLYTASLWRLIKFWFGRR